MAVHIMKFQVTSLMNTTYLYKSWVRNQNIVRLDKGMVYLMGRLLETNFNSFWYFLCNNLPVQVPELLTYCVEGLGQVRHLLSAIPLQDAHAELHTYNRVLENRGKNERSYRRTGLPKLRHEEDYRMYN